MELRKIQVTGGSTHVVSLPKKWVDRNGLRRSDTVAIHEETDGSLLLIPRSEGKADSKVVTLQLPDNASRDDVARRLVGAYVGGADEMHVKSTGKMAPQVRQHVRDIARDLVGVEILEESSSAMTLQDLVGISELDLRRTLTRMQRIARIMYDDAILACKLGDTDAAKEIIRRDDELDRLLWMVSKQMHALLEKPRLAARLNVLPAEALNLFLAARALERMGDHAAKIAHNVVEIAGDAIPEQVLESLMGQADIVRRLWDDAFSSLKKPDFAQASQAADRGEEAARWRKRFLGVVGGLDHELVGPLVLIADSIDRTRGYAVDLAETAMNQTFQKPPAKSL